MKNIFQIIDSEGWAIDTLAKAIIKYNPHYSWKRMVIHPKDLEQGKVDWQQLRFNLNWSDVVDCQYWRDLSQLLETPVKDILLTKKIILTHHNEKNLLSYEWPQNVHHIVKTKYSEGVIRDYLLKKGWDVKAMTYIPNSYDHTVFEYNQKLCTDKIVGYVGRIAPWKGLKEVAKVCFELGYPLMIMGKHDKPSYFAEIPKEHQDNMMWDYFNCEDKDRPDFYKHIACYVGNSGSGREVGTLGFIEALATGVPVVTTPAGLAADIAEHEENMMLFDYDDVDEMKECIQRVVEQPQFANRLRQAGWETIRNFNDERMALQYRKVFNKILLEGKPLVSVIIPTTKERETETTNILNALKEQTHKTLEAVVIYDEKYSAYPEVWRDYPFAVKILETGKPGSYGLGMARNLGVIEADGKYIMFCDSRLKPEPDAIQVFLSKLTVDKSEKAWLFGEKGGNKPQFVENFSMVQRDHFIRGGMSNERINAYGGMSQELRERFAAQGFKFIYVPDAKAEQMTKSSMTSLKRKGIIEMKNLLYKLNLN